MEAILPGLEGAPHIHPVFVHFPVALLPAALLFWALGMWRGSEELLRCGRWLLYLGVLGAAAALGTGLLAAEQLGHDSPGHDLVHVHRNWMYAAGALALLSAAAAFALRRSQARGARLGVGALLLATVVVLLLGADRGALLVFRHGIGTAGEPPPLAREHGEHAGHHH
ncbi:MAG: hypothetical protein KatS3mg102_2337 [Planctomycetota bacterium]|nr:MAG: hypothetical protein KatS3mg102_2337 [Planctomycetota bacterium]